MLVLLCIVWVANLAMACAESNKAWVVNLFVALALTVQLVAIQVGAMSP